LRFRLRRFRIELIALRSAGVDSHIMTQRSNLSGASATTANDAANSGSRVATSTHAAPPMHARKRPGTHKIMNGRKTHFSKEDIVMLLTSAYT
jgi:hypothetical protein